MLNLLSKTRSGHLLRPYYYGEHRWDDYLIDIQETIAELETDGNVSISHQSSVGDVDVLAITLDDINAGIEDLGARFEWGFSLMLDRQEKQIGLLNQIVDQLSAIREAVQLPATTRAKELFILGQRDLRKGLFPEALQKFLAAERENQVNFPLQLQIGKLLLYGRNATDNVIDLPKAEQHFYLASRYAGRSQKWLKYHGIALFHAAIAAYLIGEKENLAGRTDSMKKCLERALNSVGFAVTTWPAAELYYLAAKCCALLSHKEEALANLAILAERDPIGYSAKADRDEDFFLIRNDVRALFRPAVEKGEAARAVRLRAEKTARIAELHAEETSCATSVKVTPPSECLHIGQSGNFCSLCGSALRVRW